MAAPPPTETATIVRVAIDGSGGSGKTAFRQAIFGQSFTEEKINSEVVQFTSTFSRLVVYEIQGNNPGKARLQPLTDLMAVLKAKIDIYWYLYDASSPTVFSTDLLEGANNSSYEVVQVLLSKADALSQGQLTNLRNSIEEKLKAANWIKIKEAYTVITQRKLVFDEDCPNCSSKNIFVNHKQLRWMCSDCNQSGSFPNSQNLDTLITTVTRALPDDVQPYFVGAQQVFIPFKQTVAIELTKKAAEQGLMVSGVAAVERITKTLWVDLAVLWPTPSGIAAKLLRLLSFSLWLSSFSERLSWVLSELVMKSKNPWTIACSGLLVSRLLWLTIGVDYKWHSEPFYIEQAAQLRELIIKAAEGPTDLSVNSHYIRLHAIIDEQYMDIWQRICKADGYDTCENFAWGWKSVDFTLNRSSDQVLGDLLKGRHLPTANNIVALAPLYLQEATPVVPSTDGVVPVPYSPSPIPIVARVQVPRKK